MLENIFSQACLTHDPGWQSLAKRDLTWTGKECVGELKEVMRVWRAGHIQVAGSFNLDVTNASPTSFCFGTLQI